MGTRENKVETYLRDEVRKLDGDTRKWVSPGRDGVPDQIIFLKSAVFLCEIKTADGGLSVAQTREHARLRELGAVVCTVYGHRGVDLLIEELKLFKRPLRKFYG